MSIYEFEGKIPLVPKSTYIHPQAAVIGDVELGEQCFVGPSAVIRGDFGKIVVGNGSSIQDNCVIHCDPDAIAIIEDRVIIGHGAILHGPCLIKQGATVGMGAIVSVRCELGTESVLAAGAFLPPGRHISSRKLALGNPVSVIKDLADHNLTANRLGVDLYQGLAHRCQSSLKLIDD